MRQGTLGLIVSVILGSLLAACVGEETGGAGGSGDAPTTTATNTGTTSTTSSATTSSTATGGGGAGGDAGAGGEAASGGTGGADLCDGDPICDDAIDCTVDTCETDGCHHVPNHASCDDDQDCTVDSCDDASGCTYALVASSACRPTIEVDYPPRGATIQDVPDSLVVVTGNVVSGAGPIATFTINGQQVPVDPMTGDFAYSHAGAPGATTLVLWAQDEAGGSATRIQGYHWAGSYAPLGEPSHPGLNGWLSEASMDDGDHTLPANDLATLMQARLDQTGVGACSAYALVTGVHVYATGIYSLYVEALSSPSVYATLGTNGAGAHVAVSFDDVSGTIHFVKTGCGGGFAEPCFGSTDYWGELNMDALVEEADLALSVDLDHVLLSTTANDTVTMKDLSVNLDDGNLFVHSFLDLGIPALQACFENEWRAEADVALGPMLVDTVTALGATQAFEVALLDDSVDPDTLEPMTVAVQLQSDFASALPVAAQGIEADLRLLASAARTVPAGQPFDANLGVPARADCAGNPQVVPIPRLADMESIWPVDAVNQTLHALWWGGLFEMTVPAAMLGGGDLSAEGITDLTIQMSALLPPLVSDCGLAEPTLRASELQFVATMDHYGVPSDVVVYAAFDTGFVVEASGTSLEMRATSLLDSTAAAQAVQDSAIGAEPVLTSVVLDHIIPSLVAKLADPQRFVVLSLPFVDLSSYLEEAAGTTVFRMSVLLTAPGPTYQEGTWPLYGEPL